MIVYRRVLLICLLVTVVLGGVWWGEQLLPRPVQAAEAAQTAPVSRALPPTVISLTQVAAGLTQPTDIAHAGDARLFIVEQAGVIRIVAADGALLATPFLDISGQVDDSGNEMGLLGLAFHPDYASNGYFYVNYTIGSPRRTRLSRFSVSGGDANAADAASELILLEFGQPNVNHNAGDLAFGPDGYLYVTSGDGGSSNFGQDNGSLLGKILRIDVDQTAGGAPECNDAAGANYTIPADNPFVDGAGGNCDEIWATGLRNPWRFSFDRQSGDLWIGDVGQTAFEEIDFVPAGDNSGPNFGWRCYEGNDPYSTGGCGPADSYTFPVHTYAHGSDNCSVTGGFVYRGAAFLDLQGYYFFTDYCSAEFFALSDVPTSTTVIPLTLAPGSNISAPTTFGEDVNGELYVASRSGGTVFLINGAVPTAVTEITTAAQPDNAFSPYVVGLTLLLLLITTGFLWRDGRS